MFHLIALAALAPTPQTLLYELPSNMFSADRGVGDIDLDGVTDFLTATLVRSGVDGTPLLDLGYGQTSWRSASGAGDFDGDGWPDLALLDFYGYLDVRSGLDGSLLSSQACADPPFCANGRRVRYLGDVDGDGLGDILYTVQGYFDGGGVQLQRGPGIIAFTANLGIDPCKEGAYRGAAGPGDLDGDGLDDFVYGFYNDYDALTSCDILGATIARSFTNGELWTLPEERLPARFGDWDGDGLADVSTFDPTGVQVVSGLTGATLLSIPAAAPQALLYGEIAHVGDVDCDGCPDILVGYPSDGWARLYSGRSGSLLWELNCASCGQDVDGLGDVDADGIPDWLVGTKDSVQIYSGAGLQPITVYCSAKTNSQGCVPAIDATGTAGLSMSAPFPITLRQVLNQKPGLLFYGTTGAAALPFLGGTLCTLPPLQRTQVAPAGGNPPPDDCSGSYLFDFNGWLQSGLDASLAPNQEVRAQFWMRDPQAMDGTGVGLSDAVAFPICP